VAEAASAWFPCSGASSPLKPLPRNLVGNHKNDRVSAREAVVVDQPVCCAGIPGRGTAVNSPFLDARRLATGLSMARRWPCHISRSFPRAGSSGCRCKAGTPAASDRLDQFRTNRLGQQRGVEAADPAQSAHVWRWHSIAPGQGWPAARGAAQPARIGLVADRSNEFTTSSRSPVSQSSGPRSRTIGPWWLAPPCPHPQHPGCLAVNRRFEGCR